MVNYQLTPPAYVTIYSLTWFIINHSQLCCITICVHQTGVCFSLNKGAMMFFSFISSRLSPQEGGGDNIPRRTRTTSRSTAISDGSAGSIPRQDQARSEM